MLKKRSKGKNYSMRNQRLAFKHKFMLGQFGLSTFYKNHFFLMRSFWAQKFINLLLVKGKKKVLLRVFFNLMVFFKNASFSRNFIEKDEKEDKTSSNVGKAGASLERKRVQKNYTTSKRLFLKKLKNFKIQLRKSIRGKLGVEFPTKVIGGVNSAKVSLLPALVNSPLGVQSRLRTFLKKNTPEHYSGRLWHTQIVETVEKEVTVRKHYLHFYRNQKLRREYFKISDTVLPSEFNVTGNDENRGYFAQLSNPIYRSGSVMARSANPALSHRVFSMGDRYGAVRFYWFFKSMEAARSSVFIQKRYIRRGVFYFVKLIPWWRQYTLVLRRLKSALQATGEFDRIEGVNLEDKLKVEFLATINGEESKSQLLLGKAETVSLLCEGRLKVHFRWKWR